MVKPAREKQEKMQLRKITYLNDESDADIKISKPLFAAQPKKHDSESDKKKK